MKRANPAADAMRIARDAKRAAAAHDEAAIPALAAEFRRLLDNPHLDKGCIALTELAAALYTLDHHDSELWLRGIRHVQIEPGFGRSVDSGIQVRSHSALGLARTSHPDASVELVKLLADSEAGARLGAARAIGMLPTEAGTLLLRFKVLSGDAEPEVIAECFASLLVADASRSIPFVARYCDDADDAIAEAAVLALGDSRLAAAIEALQQKWMRTVSGPIRRILLIALATARRQESLEFLLKLLREEHPKTAKEVLDALRIYRHDDSAWARITEIAASREL